MYTQYQHTTNVTLANVMVVNNLVQAQGGSGGGLGFDGGGWISIINSTITYNTATFGGGLSFGFDVATCGFQIVDSWIAGNIAPHSGAQLYSMCPGTISFIDSRLELNTSSSQVAVTCVD